jgi:L-fuculose-phosphate aldolase
LANHGTVTFGPNLENAYFNTEIIDAYCRILILARQIGPINYFTEQQTKELLDIKKRLGYDDPRFRCENCDLCGNSIFERGYSEFVPQPKVFKREDATCQAGRNGQVAESEDFESLVRVVTDRVMAALGSERRG